MEAELDQVDGRPIIGPERRLECLIALSEGFEGSRRPMSGQIPSTAQASRVLFGLAALLHEGLKTLSFE